jgi:serine/threonine protein kinase
MIHRWRQEERPTAEQFLARHPQLWEHPEAAADLIYEELCLRQEYGLEVSAEQVLDRFPQWRPQLEVLLDCQRLLGPRCVAPWFPEAGEVLGDFLLLAELGRGAHARVFLASQLSLGSRPVVLKLTPLSADEHLSLARLQHTHIVPLYCAQDHPARGLRALCMPYFGGATLARMLEAMAHQPPHRRSGRDLCDALDRLGAGGGLDDAAAAGRAAPPCTTVLAGASYAEAVCWIGACLAEALGYAHEHGLVHLDLKPSNVLLTADGQPMVLDFHLAREALHPGGEGPAWLGGTPGYMSPEQEAAVQAVGRCRVVPRPVDGRSDVYSLGVVLYEALAGSALVPGARPRPLHRCNAQVSVGLSDMVGKCLAEEPARRYPDMASLATDLRQHLAHRPLVGVRNRSLVERWRKWRRRRPHRLAVAAMLPASLTALAAAAVGAANQFGRRLDAARTALHDARTQMDRGEWDGAIQTLRRGLSAARGLPGQRKLAGELDHRLHLAQQQQAAGELHQLADQLRFLYGADYLRTPDLRSLAVRCGRLWEQRGLLVRQLDPDGAAAQGADVRDDLLDLAIFWADFQARQARRKALAVLDEAEALLGPSPVLDAERTLHGRPTRAHGTRGAQTVWEHYALGRALLRSGSTPRAAREVARAVQLDPQGLWPNFYQGVCAYRLGRYEDAALSYSVCIGAAPRPAGCFYNRALALAALGRAAAARRDRDEALRLDPGLAGLAYPDAKNSAPGSGSRSR